MLKKHKPQFIASAESKYKIRVRESKYDKIKYDADKKRTEELSVKLKVAIIKFCGDMLLGSMRMKTVGVHVISVFDGVSTKVFCCIIYQACI